jgi:hypothetical protein
MKAIKLTLLVICFTCFSGLLPAQVTKIMGTITDAETKEPLPFVNIIIVGTTVGTLTDFSGNYAIETKSTGDSIRFSMMGYRAATRKITLHQFQTIDLTLAPEEMNLPEVVIKYKGNPAEVILKKIILNKEKNSLQSFDAYQYHAYTKIEIDANNISEKLKNQKFMKPFGFVFNYMDTSTVNGKPYLPVFLSETMSEIYFRKNPRSKKEIINATRTSGFENLDFSQFLGTISQEVDIYANYILLFQKNFISPIADFGLDYYKYYLVDSLYLGNQWCYQLMFKPRHKQELTFSGKLWVADTSFAIRKIELKIAGDANLNFINDMMIKQEYEWTDNRFWMITKDYMVADFNILDKSRKTLGFFGHRTTIAGNYSFDPKDNGRFLSSPANILKKEDAGGKDEQFWEKNRPEQLSKKEVMIYKMSDTVKSLPIFHRYNDLFYGLFTGYLSWGKFEIGPYFRLYSFNDLEGNRFRLGARTGNNLSKKFQLEGYLAYGTKDQTLKYGADLLYSVWKNPRRMVELSYKYDVEQLGTSFSSTKTDNLLASIFHRGPNNKLTMTREYLISYDHEWFTGFSNTLSLKHREIFPLGSTEFIIYPYGPSQPVLMPSIYTSEIRLDLRLSFRERFISGEFYRYTISSNYPIIQVSYCYGLPDVFKSDFEYQKVELNLKQWFNFATIGWSKYIIQAGKVWGTLPYSLLKIQDGNQTFFFDEYSSNLMNYYEFVSDEYVSAYYTHHFEGLLFNKLPLLRKLKWREVAYIQGVYGNLAGRNRTFSKFPDQLRGFNKEIYWETGAGIENIFKVFRIDCIWRLSHLHDKENPNVSKFGVFASANFSF